MIASNNDGCVKSFLVIAGFVAATWVVLPLDLAFGEDVQPVGKRLEAAGARIKAAVANGEITTEQAWAEWYATKEQLIDSAVDSGELSSQEAASLQHDIHKSELGEKLGSAGARIKQAVAEGELTADQARAEWHAAKDELIADAVNAGQISTEDAAEFRHEIHKAELGDRLGAAGGRIKQAVADGEMTGDEAWAEWYAAKDELIADAVDAGQISIDDAAEFHKELHKAELGERLGAAGARVKSAAADGELTEDEAWVEWHLAKEALINEAVDAGEITEADAAEFRRGIERAEVGERLKAAVANGEMTEEEAWTRWAEINEQANHADAVTETRPDHQSDTSRKPPTAADHPWARYVRKFIARYRLTDQQQRQAWRFYRAARQQPDAMARRLEAVEVHENNPRMQAERQRAREAVERAYDRHFKRLKAVLERLPTPSQRRDAKARTEAEPVQRNGS